MAKKKKGDEDLELSIGLSDKDIENLGNEVADETKKSAEKALKDVKNKAKMSFDPTQTGGGARARPQLPKSLTGDMFTVNAPTNVYYSASKDNGGYQDVSGFGAFDMSSAKAPRIAPAVSPSWTMQTQAGTNQPPPRNPPTPTFSAAPQQINAATFGAPMIAPQWGGSGGSGGGVNGTPNNHIPGINLPVQQQQQAMLNLTQALMLLATNVGNVGHTMQNQAQQQQQNQQPQANPANPTSRLLQNVYSMGMGLGNGAMGVINGTAPAMSAMGAAGMLEGATGPVAGAVAGLTDKLGQPVVSSVSNGLSIWGRQATGASGATNSMKEKIEAQNKLNEEKMAFAVQFVGKGGKFNPGMFNTSTLNGVTFGGTGGGDSARVDEKGRASNVPRFWEDNNEFRSVLKGTSLAGWASRRKDEGLAMHKTAMGQAGMFFKAHFQDEVDRNKAYDSARTKNDPGGAHLMKPGTKGYKEKEAEKPNGPPHPQSIVILKKSLDGWLDETGTADMLHEISKRFDGQSDVFRFYKGRGRFDTGIYGHSYRS